MNLRQKSQLIFLVAVFLLGIFLRFYNLRKNVNFNWDQEVTAEQIRLMVTNKKPILIGIRIEPAKFFLPPLYYYLATPFLVLTKFDPIGLYYYSGLLGFITGVAIYIFTQKIFVGDINKNKFAIIASLIYFISPLFIVSDRTPSGVNLLILPSLICFLSLINIGGKKESLLDYIFLGIAIGLGLNAHFTAIFLVIISFLWLVWKKKISTYLFLTLGIIFLFISPLIIFDVRHQFFNTKAFLEFIQGNKNLIPPPFSLIFFRLIKNIFIIMEFWGTMIVGPIIFWGKPVIGLVLLALLIKRLIFAKRKLKAAYSLGIISILVSSFLFTFYNGGIPEYYFFIVIPFFILFLADLIFSILRQNRTNIYFLALILVTIIIYNFTVIRADVGDSLYHKQQVASFIKDNPVKITYATSSLGRNFGYPHLLNLNNIIVNENASVEYIIKYPLSECLRKNDYTQFGNIGINRKEISYDDYYRDYFDDYYLFAFDLPKEWNLVECGFEKSLHTYSMINRQKGSCLDSLLGEDIKQIRFWMGDDKKIIETYNSFDGEEFKINKTDQSYFSAKKQVNELSKYLVIIPRSNDKSLLIEFETRDNIQINEKVLKLILSLKIYAA